MEQGQPVTLSELLALIFQGAQEITQDIALGNEEKLHIYLAIAARLMDQYEAMQPLYTASNMMLIYMQKPDTQHLAYCQPDDMRHELHIHLLKPNSTKVLCTYDDQLCEPDSLYCFTHEKLSAIIRHILKKKMKQGEVQREGRDYTLRFLQKKEVTIRDYSAYSLLMSEKTYRIKPLAWHVNAIEAIVSRQLTPTIPLEARTAQVRIDTPEQLMRELGAVIDIATALVTQITAFEREESFL